MARTQQVLDFSLAVDDDREPTVIRVEGDLDSYTAGALRESFSRVLGRPTVVDIRGVPFVDSSGLGALVGGIRRVREAGGAAAVCCTRTSVLRLLEVTGIDRSVDVTATPEEAEAVIAAEQQSAPQQ